MLRLRRDIILALDGFDFDGDGDVFTNQNTPGFEDYIPAQPVVRTVDFGAGIEAGAGGTPWAFGFANKVGVESDGVGYPFDGQIAMNLAGVFASHFNRRALEGDIGEGGGIKELR